ncbi:hypothetical protein DMC30DRAFT_388028 [Rhodotorula diobovata]|uniref:Uncharacterized protein n=1 Tax=Rhodotorula diobovata TaxID=5288 RepID=A0A5C5G6H3_9BASI|nr:hypothetical protein DMC30DRAFT_388028 [Rhodotorula diobovata]
MPWAADWAWSRQAAWPSQVDCKPLATPLSLKRGGIEGGCSIPVRALVTKGWFEAASIRQIEGGLFDHLGSTSNRTGVDQACSTGPPTSTPPWSTPLLEQGIEQAPFDLSSGRVASTGPLPALLDQGIESGLFDHCSNHTLPPLVDYYSTRPPSSHPYSTSRHATAASSSPCRASRPPSPPRLASSPCAQSAYLGAVEGMLPSSRAEMRHSAVISCRVCAQRERATGWNVENRGGEQQGDTRVSSVRGRTAARETKTHLYIG